MSTSSRRKLLVVRDHSALREVRERSPWGEWWRRVTPWRSALAPGGRMLVVVVATWGRLRVRLTTQRRMRATATATISRRRARASIQGRYSTLSRPIALVHPGPVFGVGPDVLLDAFGVERGQVAGRAEKLLLGKLRGVQGGLPLREADGRRNADRGRIDGGTDLDPPLADRLPDDEGGDGGQAQPQGQLGRADRGPGRLAEVGHPHALEVLAVMVEQEPDRSPGAEMA